MVPGVVPDIPVIHRLIRENFASPTRGPSAWSLGDRDGGSRPPRTAGNGKMGAAGTKDPISAGRQCRGSFGSGDGASREEAPEELVFLKRDAAFSGLRIVGSKAGRTRDRPKKGRGTSDGLAFGPACHSKDQRTLGRRSQVEGLGFSPGESSQLGCDA